MPRTPSAYRAALRTVTRPPARVLGLLALFLGVTVATVATSATAYAAPHRATHHGRHHHHTTTLVPTTGTATTGTTTPCSAAPPAAWRTRWGSPSPSAASPTCTAQPVPGPSTAPV